MRQNCIQNQPFSYAILEYYFSFAQFHCAFNTFQLQNLVKLFFPLLVLKSDLFPILIRWIPSLSLAQAKAGCLQKGGRGENAEEGLSLFSRAYRTGSIRKSFDPTINSYTFFLLDIKTPSL